MGRNTAQVPSISCGHCVKTIEREVGEVKGVTAVDANEESREVTVEWEDGTTSWAAIVELLNEINYPPAST